MDNNKRRDIDFKAGALIGSITMAIIGIIVFNIIMHAKPKPVIKIDPISIVNGKSTTIDTLPHERAIITTAEHKGHTYIALQGSSGRGGLLHDPDCKCTNKAK